MPEAVVTAAEVEVEAAPLRSGVLLRLPRLRMRRLAAAEVAAPVLVRFAGLPLSDAGRMALAEAARRVKGGALVPALGTMLDPRNFGRRGFAAGTLSVSVQFFSAFGFLFLALPYLQLVMGYSPLQAAGALVPMALVVIPLSRIAPAIAARFGVRIAGAAGLSLMALGFVVYFVYGRRHSRLGQRQEAERTDA